MKKVLAAALFAAVLFVPVAAAAPAGQTGASWSGTWTRLATEIDPGGPTTFTLHQTGHKLTGSIPWKGCTTKKGGLMAGWAEGLAAVLASRQSDGSLVLVHLSLSSDGGHISGRWQVTAGTCSGSSGRFTATRKS